MTGVTQLLAKSLEKTMLNNLGETTVRKIQDRLFERYGMSITQSMEEFEKALADFKPTAPVQIKQPLFDGLKNIFGKDVEVILR